MIDVQWSFVSLVVASAMHLLLRMVLGYELGPSGLGLYTLVFTIYMFGMQFASFGIGAGVTKYVSQYIDSIDKMKEMISCGIVGSIITGSLMAILLYSSSSIISIHIFHNTDMINLLKITSICFPFIAVQKTVLGILNGLRKMKYFAAVDMTQNISMFILSFILVNVLKMNVTGAVLGFLIPSIIVSLLSTFIIKDYMTDQSEFYINLKELIWFGMVIVLSNSISLFNTQVDSLMIGHFMTETDVGYYSIAVILVQGITLIPDSLQRIVFPLIANYYGKNNYEMIAKLIKSTLIKTSFIIVLISLSLLIFGKILISALFGKEFLSAYKPLLVLLAGYLIYSPSRAIGGVLPGIGKENVMFKINCFSTMINLLLNILFIPKLGLLGAALATSLSLTLTAVTRYHFTIKYIFRDHEISIT